MTRLALRANGDCGNNGMHDDVRRTSCVNVGGGRCVKKYVLQLLANKLK